MTAFAIETHSLSKQFGRKKKPVLAVDKLDLQVEAGQVYGFLGPNGAGKTTTIRILLDLVRPTSGEARLFGQPTRQVHEVLRRVGALVEGATFYPYLSGRKNLEVLARTGGCYDASRIDRLIHQVGMSDRANRRAGGYSTGMKQRLGIAAALLSDPELIILDEPTNGLDPAGIQEMRRFIGALVKEQGKTVFLSSHMLGEVEQVCDRVAIINKGHIVREGKVGDLLAERARLRIDVTPVEKASAILSDHWRVMVTDGVLLAEAARDDAPAIVRKLVEHDIQVFEVSPQRQSLESFFLSVTQEESDGEPFSR
ncbi:MAG: ABC transporter ATP-binding protein [Anaerolineae bacterium]|nr:ABC transporter ATP-binding protein [Anaerolineae bacterium]